MPSRNIGPRWPAIAWKHYLAVLLTATAASLSVLIAGFSVSPSVAQAKERTWTTNLGPIGFATIIVDSQRKHVLVSGPVGNVVDILDYSGRLVATIHNVPGAAGMVILGNSLYVAERSAGAIAKIDLNHPEQEPVVVATGIDAPYQLVSAGGLLWTASWSGNWIGLVSINPTTGATSPPSFLTFYMPDLATSPSDPNTIFVAEDGLSPGYLYRLDVSSGKPVIVAESGCCEISNFEGLAISPDGTRVIPANGSPYEFVEFNAATLQPDGVIYPGKPYPSAVAVSPEDGGLVATSLTWGENSPNVAVARIGTPTPIFTATTTFAANGDNGVLTHGLALAPDRHQIFAVTNDSGYTWDGANIIVTSTTFP